MKVDYNEVVGDFNSDLSVDTEKVFSNNILVSTTINLRGNDYGRGVVPLSASAPLDVIFSTPYVVYEITSELACRIWGSFEGIGDIHVFMYFNASEDELVILRAEGNELRVGGYACGVRVDKNALEFYGTGEEDYIDGSHVFVDPTVGNVVLWHSIMSVFGSDDSEFNLGNLFYWVDYANSRKSGFTVTQEEFDNLMDSKIEFIERNGVKKQVRELLIDEEDVDSLSELCEYENGYMPDGTCLALAKFDMRYYTLRLDGFEVPIIRFGATFDASMFEDTESEDYVDFSELDILDEDEEPLDKDDDDDWCDCGNDSL